MMRSFNRSLRLNEFIQVDPNPMWVEYLSEQGNRTWRHREKVMWQQWKETVTYKPRRGASKVNPAVSTPWSRTLSLHNSEEINFCCLWYLARAPQANECMITNTYFYKLSSCVCMYRTKLNVWNNFWLTYAIPSSQ